MSKRTVKAEQVLMMKKAFDKYEKGGKLGRAELRQLLKEEWAKEPTEGATQKMMDSVAKGSSTIDFPEFVAIICNMMDGTSIAEEQRKLGEWWRVNRFNLGDDKR